MKLLSNLAFLNLRDEEYNRAYELLLKAQTIDPEDPAVKHLKQELAKRTGVDEEDGNVIDA
ncbi:MAG TPA: hypothetical protein DIW48_03685 [Sphaerochaeta sp.]|nr:hypothetical protein [Sphaerochaeta sp.]